MNAVGDSDFRMFSVRHVVLTGMVRDRKYVIVTTKVHKRKEKYQQFQENKKFDFSN